jgi:hypothetical protein
MTERPSKPDTAAPGAAVQRPAPPRTRRTGGFRRFLAGVAMVAVIGAAAHATFPVWWPRVESRLAGMGIEFDGIRDPRVAGLADRVKVLEEMARGGERVDPVQDLEVERAKFSKDLAAMVARMDALENAVTAARRMADAATLQQSGPSGVETAEAVQRLTERLKRLEGTGEDITAVKDRLSRLEEALKPDAPMPEAEASATVARDIADLTQRIAALEETRGQAATGSVAAAPALVLAVGQLREAIRAGHPYMEHLEALKAVAQPGPVIAEAIGVLQPHAATGVPTQETLHRRFEDMAAVITRPTGLPAGDSWMDRTMSNLSSLVVIRRSDTQSGSEPLLAAAREALVRDDLRGAIQAVRQLEGRPAEAAAPWLAEAKARFTVDEALAVLHNHAVAQTGGSRG